MDVPGTITKIQARVSNGRFKTTVFSDFECYGGVLVWQNLVESDIVFVNVFLNLHWQLALRLRMVMMLDSEVSVHQTLGVGAVSQRPENQAARLGDGYGGASTLAYDISTQAIAMRPLAPTPASRPARNVLPLHDGVGCSVLTTYTARSAMHMNAPHVLSACWTSAKTKRVWEAVLRALNRDTRTWCLGKSGSGQRRWGTVSVAVAKASECLESLANIPEFCANGLCASESRSPLPQRPAQPHDISTRRMQSCQHRSAQPGCCVRQSRAVLCSCLLFFWPGAENFSQLSPWNDIRILFLLLCPMINRCKNFAHQIAHFRTVCLFFFGLFGTTGRDLIVFVLVVPHDNQV